MSNSKQIFKEAFALIKKRKQWTQGAYAKDKDGDTVGQFNDNEPVCWCSVGAIEHIEQKYDVKTALRTAMNEFCKETRDYPLVAYNDAHTHRTVVKLWNDFGKDKGWIK